MSYPRTILLLLALLATAAIGVAEDFVKPDNPPVPVRTPPPKYPTQLKRDGVSGTVLVSIVIDEKGHVDAASISKSSRPEFEDPALDAVKQWRFKPAKKDGKAVRTKVALPLRFSAN